jgi:hypothetical protein
MIEQSLKFVKNQISEIDTSIDNIELEIQVKNKEIQGLKKLRNSFQNILKNTAIQVEKSIPATLENPEKLLNLDNKKTYSMNEGDSEEWYEEPTEKPAKVVKMDSKKESK